MTKTRRSNSIGSKSSNSSRRRVVRIVKRKNKVKGYRAKPLEASRGILSKSFAASAYATGQRNREPIINAGPKMTRITHRELVATLSGTVSATVPTVTSLVLNPGLSATFPWLSTQAVGWEQYTFTKLCFEYVTRCGSTTTGSVILAPDYDVLDPPPATEQVAMSYRDSTEDVPWQDQVCQLDPSAMHPIGPRKWIRSTGIASSDLKTYDVGTLHACTLGQADTNPIGKLYVCYDVTFYVPQTTPTGASLNRSLAMFNLSSNQAFTDVTEATIVYDQTIVNDMGIVNNSGVFTLPAGSWLVTAETSASDDSNANTAYTLKVEINKDNAALTIPAISFNGCTAVGTGAQPNLSNVCSGYIVSNGTTTARVRMTWDSTAGNITATANRCRVLFRLY